MLPTTSKPLLVIDACVAAKWYLQDEESPEPALALRRQFSDGQFAIAMPDIARYEVANALDVARRRGRMGEDESREAIADFLVWDFAYVGSDGLLLAAMETAQRVGCAFYDALYLALAEELDAPLVTADRRLVHRVQARAPFVRWLGDYGRD